MAKKGTANTATVAVKDRAALVTIQQSHDVHMAERSAQLAKHAAQTAQKIQDFKATIEGYRTQLNQTEKAFDDEVAAVNEAWKTTNASIDNHNEQYRQLLADKIALLPAQEAPADAAPGSDHTIV